MHFWSITCETYWLKKKILNKKHNFCYDNLSWQSTTPAQGNRVNIHTSDCLDWFVNYFGNNLRTRSKWVRITQKVNISSIPHDISNEFHKIQIINFRTFSGDDITVCFVFLFFRNNFRSKIVMDGITAIGTWYSTFFQLI